MDVTNPGLVNVADQAFRPALPGVNSLAIPLDDDVLVPIADQAEPPAENDATAVLPVAAESIVAGQTSVPASQDFAEVPGVAPHFLPFPTDNLANNVANQNLTSGTIAEFIVAGPDISIQTNPAPETKKTYTVASVRDADTGGIANVNTTRFRLGITPNDLASFGLSMLGRQIVFDDNIFTVNNEGAARLITSINNIIVIDRSDPNDQTVPVMDVPQVGDTFALDVQRQGSEVVTKDTNANQDVVILPPPLVNEPTGIANFNSQGTVDVSVGPQSGEPIISSGVRVPTAITVNIADQEAVIGLPVNVFP
jgi:hypothetical protein